MAAPASDRCGKCAFFVDKKKRFCKMLVAKGHKFCGEHANMDTNVYEDGGRRRIACPLDPKHSFLFHLSFGKSTNCSDKFFCCVVSTVSEDKLHKHLKKCNSRGKPKAVYYVENINAGSADQNEQTLPQVSLCERSATQLRHLLDTLNAASKGLPFRLEEHFVSHAVFQEEANNPKNGDSAHKHLKQQSSILGHLEALGLLGRGRCFVEFGAGRGKLSHWIHRALREQTPPPPAGEPLQMLLVERSSTRFKARPRTESMRGFGRRPKKGRRAQFGGQRTLASWPPTRPFKIKAALLCVQVDGKHQDADVEFARLQIDIQHLDLSKAPDRDRDRDQSSRDPFSQIWLFAVCSQHRRRLDNKRARRENAAKRRLTPQRETHPILVDPALPADLPSKVLADPPIPAGLLVLLGFWAWRWHCAVTIVASGVTMWVRNSSLIWVWVPPSSRASAACPAGPRAACERHLIREPTKNTNR
ncbi:tRNA:m(4)X modification enzyme TRM13 homolog isoform X9 [Phyllopteryx taeniolatus]|uniref:tRNA:m(4)X modification enzyme TRM13 homolog isoform X9 n=1 Tax=Phyllopteryx taeniolatus TaxID=161469 RepID=UPI002AD4A5C9|nr:tRNA:m(4)X modification enzyme TRM13 homolog isoform X9 [Phyllopteryx taeniolatus]